MRFYTTLACLVGLASAATIPSNSTATKTAGSAASSTTAAASAASSSGLPPPPLHLYPNISFTQSDSFPLVPLFNATDADPAVIKALKTIPFPRTLLSTLAHAQGLFVPLMGVLGGSFDGLIRILPIEDWLIIVCRTGIVLDAEYVFDNNAHALTIIGWSSDKINSLNMTNTDIAAGLGPWTPRQRILFAIIDQQLAARTNDLSTMHQALNIFTVPEIVEALILIGTYTTFAGVARGLRVAQDSSMPGLDPIIRTIITSNYAIVNQGN